MRLSVVIPTLNEHERLPGLLRSLRAGSEPADEILVVDGGSTDGTCAVALDCAGVRLIASERGRGAQLKRGAAEATGDVLLFLHADTCPAASALSDIRVAFQDSGLVAAGLEQRVAQTGRMYRWIENFANARVRRGMIYGDSGLCVRRADYEAVGGFRPLPIFEDVDLSRRLRRRSRQQSDGGDIRLLSGTLLEISARRWEREGVVRRSVKNWFLTQAYRVGVAPARLARYYQAEPQAESPDGRRKSREERK